MYEINEKGPTGPRQQVSLFEVHVEVYIFHPSPPPSPFTPTGLQTFSLLSDLDFILTVLTFQLNSHSIISHLDKGPTSILITEHRGKHAGEAVPM